MKGIGRLICVLTLLAGALVATSSEAASASGPSVGVASISTGLQHACALTTDGQLFCWGANSWGQVGDGTILDKTSPVAIGGALRFKSVSAGWADTCAITTTDVLYCWGKNASGEFGNGTTTGSTSPLLINNGFTVRSVSVGEAMICVVTSTDEGRCAGYNGDGRLGVGPSSPPKTTPVLVSGLPPISKISSSNNFGCALTTANVAYCWGRGASGQLGNGASVDSTSAVQVSGGLSFRQISTGGNSTCALTGSGVAYCWGAATGVVGDGTSTLRNEPAMVAGGLTFSSVSNGDNHNCGVTTAGDGYCWGRGYLGKLANGSQLDRSSPTSLAGSTKWLALAGGQSYSCGVTNGGGVRCAGSNQYGVLGRSSSDTSVVLVMGETFLHSADSTSSLAAQVNPSLTFTVSGDPGGCNGQAQSVNASSTGSSVNLGSLNAFSTSTASQLFTAVTNATSGYDIWIRGTTGSLSDSPSSHTSLTFRMTPHFRRLVPKPLAFCWTGRTPQADGFQFPQAT